MELLRRALLVAGLFAFLWMALIPVGPLVAVDLVDFAAMQRRLPRWSSDAKLEPAAFVASVTGQRTSRGDAAAWARVLAAAEDVALGRPPPAPFDARRGRGRGGEAVYLTPDDPTVRGLDPPVDDARPVAFVPVERDGGVRWLQATWLSPRDASSVTPSRLLHPLRGVSWLVLLAAIALYVLLPRWKRGPSTASYHRVRAVVLPDVLGLLMTGLFLALPMFVVPASSPGGSLFSGDWVALTAISWAMAGFGLALFWAAAWYAALRYEVLGDAVRRVTLFEDRTIPLESIAAVEPVTLRAPRGLVRLGLLLGLFRPALLGQALLLAGRTDEALEIVLRDGSRVRLLLTALENAGPLRKALERATGGPLPNPARPGKTRSSRRPPAPPSSPA